MKIKIFLLLLVAFVVTPASADAYFTTDQRATQINETTTLYAIEYKFGHQSNSYYLPARANRDQAWGTNNGQIGFSILEDGKRVTDAGNAVGVVISNSELTDDEMYKTPRGLLKTFTLYVILTTDPDAPEADYAVKVTDLPFYLGDSREYQKLNETELRYYQTPEVEFNSSNQSK